MSVSASIMGRLYGFNLGHSIFQCHFHSLTVWLINFIFANRSSQNFKNWPHHHCSQEREYKDFRIPSFSRLYFDAMNIGTWRAQPCVSWCPTCAKSIDWLIDWRVCCRTLRNSFRLDQASNWYVKSSSQILGFCSHAFKNIRSTEYSANSV